ncbi:MAG: hypothetical protein ACUZ8N_05550 [Candidatus Scalindua sp.]
MIITPGFTFLSPTPEYNTKHLFIVISIINDNTKALCVNVTTKKDRDMSCILKAGDHEFIKHDSVINYGDAIIPKIDKLIEAINKGLMEPNEPIDDDLLSEIINGAKISNAFPQGFLKHLP